VKLFFWMAAERLVKVIAGANGAGRPSFRSSKRAAKYRDLISTVEQLHEKQRIAAWKAMMLMCSAITLKMECWQ